MQMRPVISCVHRKLFGIPWLGALAAVAIIVSPPNARFFGPPTSEVKRCRYTILVYYIPERKAIFAICVWRPRDILLIETAGGSRFCSAHFGSQVTDATTAVTQCITAQPLPCAKKMA